MDGNHAPSRGGEAGIDAEISERCRHEREILVSSPAPVGAQAVRFMPAGPLTFAKTCQADIFSMTESDISKFA